MNNARANGTLHGEQEIRVLPLSEGTRLSLADELQIVWHYAS